jgi:DNA-binding transcriptional ArsR family regulator
VTPAYEDLLRVMPPTSALLYRLVWRLSRGAAGEHGCRLPLREIARRLGVAPSTVLLHLRALVRAGYVSDLTPGRRPGAHLYVVTSKPVCPGDPRLRVFGPGKEKR